MTAEVVSDDAWVALRYVLLAVHPQPWAVSHGPLGTAVVDGDGCLIVWLAAEEAYELVANAEKVFGHSALTLIEAEEMARLADRQGERRRAGWTANQLEVI